MSSKHDKRKSRSSPSKGSQSGGAPPPFLPLVMGVPREEFEFSDVQISCLEEAGRIKFSEKQKEGLVILARVWIDDLRVRGSARPKQFRERLEKMVEAFSQAEEACRLNEIVGSLDRHLLHWAMETPATGAAMFPGTLAALERQLQIVGETVAALLECLPQDPGKRRPFDDERRIILLADIFEEAGGKAMAYLSADGAMADTEFRKFAQQFYLLLPADDKRGSGGLDEALRGSLMARRAQRPAFS
jgi:hypothetical protein